MKKIFFVVLLSAGLSVAAQDFSSGALPTDPAIYSRIGQAPLPAGSAIPASVDLSSRMPPPGSQAPQNSCVAWAVAYANYSYINAARNNCAYFSSGQPNPQCLFSPSFVYNQINGGQNRGTYFQDAFRIMQQQGVAPLSAMPYIPNNWWIQPDENARRAAAQYKISSYWQLGRSGEDFFMETKAWLAKGIPVIASVKVDNYLKKMYGFPDPYVWTNWSGAPENMGHAILITGYDDNRAVFKFINSYGSNWGNKGYGYISYTMFRQVLNEAFIIKTQEAETYNTPIFSQEEKTLSRADRDSGLDFVVDTVNHVLFPPGYNPSPAEFFNSSMTFRGHLRIPPGLGRKIQVAIYFYKNVQNRKGPFVGSVNPMMRTLRGQAVTQTPELFIDPRQPYMNSFWASFRYADLGIPKGYPNQVIQSDLIAEPVLLVDDFPVRIGRPHFFFVRL